MKRRIVKKWYINFIKQPSVSFLTKYQKYSYRRLMQFFPISYSNKRNGIKYTLVNWFKMINYLGS